MMWLMSTVAYFLTDISLGTSPNFSKGWCTRDLKIIIFLILLLLILDSVDIDAVFFLDSKRLQT